MFSFEDELVPQVLGPFKEANPNLDVQTATFTSSDEAVTKLQAGFQADVVNVCVRDTQRLVDLGLIQPIDTSRITDWDSIIPAFKDFAGVKVNDTGLHGAERGRGRRIDLEPQVGAGRPDVVEGCL